MLFVVVPFPVAVVAKLETVPPVLVTLSDVLLSVCDPLLVELELLNVFPEELVGAVVLSVPVILLDFNELLLLPLELEDVFLLDDEDLFEDDEDFLEDDEFLEEEDLSLRIGFEAFTTRPPRARRRGAIGGRPTGRVGVAAELESGEEESLSLSDEDDELLLVEPDDEDEEEVEDKDEEELSFSALATQLILAVDVENVSPEDGGVIIGGVSFDNTLIFVNSPNDLTGLSTGKVSSELGSGTLLM